MSALADAPEHAARPRPASEDDMPRMTLSEHLNELRGRLLKCALALLVCMGVSFGFYDALLGFVVEPYRVAARSQGLADAQLVAIGVGEGFIATMKLCFLAALVAASPVVLWQLWQFVAAGLYDHEKRVVRIFFPVGLLLFGLGLACAYLLLIPFGLSWLMGFNAHSLGIRSDFRFSDYISFCVSLVFGMGIAFQLPLVLLFLQGAGVVDRATLKRYWRHAVVLAFVLGAVLTADPSPVTQILMSLPLVGLYFLAIWGGQFVGESKQTFRWWRAWPLYLGVALFVLLLVYSQQLTAWWSSR